MLTHNVLPLSSVERFPILQLRQDYLEQLPENCFKTF
jgi:hypothetical protein